MEIIYRRIVQQTMLMTREFYAFPPGFPGSPKLNWKRPEAFCWASAAFHSSCFIAWTSSDHRHDFSSCAVRWDKASRENDKSIRRRDKNTQDKKNLKNQNLLFSLMFWNSLNRFLILALAVRPEFPFSFSAQQAIRMAIPKESAIAIAVALPLYPCSGTWELSLGNSSWRALLQFQGSKQHSIHPLHLSVHPFICHPHDETCQRWEKKGNRSAGSTSNKWLTLVLLGYIS